MPNGGKIPLSELAEITYQKGAAKISRDDTRRRIVVGVNVRNRDLQSVVDDVQKLIDDNVELPVGITSHMVVSLKIYRAQSPDYW
ncbi:cobalt-zinc-cadmium resistance protein CzcA [Nonlabens ulvanivorans]|uniref:Cobalt-zinc-cadmium resistance protein CzcA n=1 Tax=Nonlabens ulvanivorans TaxID=906888 RepID=A0A090WC24_NONUL|nr:cobalt-zinc-cadmium resistance protein CzcA [Nonlabens ulvanivorans]